VVNPADIYVLVGLSAFDRPTWTYRELGNQLDVPVPLVQRALKRSSDAGLYEPTAKRVHLANFEEFLVHAVRFVAPARLGEVVPGVPAAWGAPPMSSLIVESADALPPVWPLPSGRVRGQALRPLHESAVLAALQHPELAELLAVVDSLRAGDVRVRAVAADVARDLLRAAASRRQ